VSPRTFTRGLPRRAATLSIAAVTTGALASTPLVAAAHAADPYRVVGTGGTLHVRSAPSLGSQVIHELSDGTPIHIACQTRGDMVVGSSMWDRIDQPYDGWVADWYTTTPVVNNYSPGFKDCLDVGIPTPMPTPAPTPIPTTAPRDLASIAWSYVNQKRVPAGVPASWRVGQFWSGHCEAFVGWVTAGPRGRKYKSAYLDYLDHRGRIHMGAPPRNTVVYWNPRISQGNGHIGISLGGGQVVSTVGMLGDQKAIAKSGYHDFPNYLGWAYP
jgi:hypothetical protein